ncbi:hypothetical protein NIES4071_87000 [Calothrix sp. NIES-4071]|nr:hypothetical protein NIES4071_87000 [Calothrix sp. NIES-4071]BAZ62967.1 hypothetical protein NIES4105_86930 [Calothrix sp. NIES-4105]
MLAQKSLVCIAPNLRIYASILILGLYSAPVASFFFTIARIVDAMC